MKMTKRKSYLHGEKSNLVFWEMFNFYQMAEKFSTFDKFHQKIDAVLVLKDILHIDKEWMVHLKKDILLHGYISKLVMFNYKVFSDAFHRV